jgi:hypothetical protein
MAKKATSRTAKSATKKAATKTTKKTTGKTVRKTAAKAANTVAKAAKATPRAATSVSFLESLSGPARRALERAGLTTARKLAAKREAEVLGLHGVGPASLPALRRALTTAGLRFRA